MSDVAIGIFVGGVGKRMGGVAKGLLLAPGGTETLVERLIGVCARAAPAASLYLVGRSPEYERLGLTQLADTPAGVGPIGGLRSLLLRARADGCATALALACDLPFLSETVLTLLLEPLASAARVPVFDERLQPLAAAYRPEPALAALDRALSLGKQALMHVLDQLGEDLEQVEFDASQARALRDWDTPEDITSH